MIGHYESHVKRPPPDRVKTITYALGISVDELLGNPEKRNKKNKQDDVSYKIMKKVRLIEKLPERYQNAIFRLINSLAENALTLFSGSVPCNQAQL